MDGRPAAWRARRWQTGGALHVVTRGGTAVTGRPTSCLARHVGRLAERCTRSHRVAPWWGFCSAMMPRVWCVVACHHVSCCDGTGRVLPCVHAWWPVPVSRKRVMASCHCDFCMTNTSHVLSFCFSEKREKQRGRWESSVGLGIESLRRRVWEMGGMRRMTRVILAVGFE